MAGEKMTTEETKLNNALYEVEDQERAFALNSRDVLIRFRRQILTGLGISITGGLVLGGMIGLIAGRRI